MALNGSNGWRHLYFTVAGAVILGILTASIAGWRQFTVLQERMEYLMKLNENQNLLFESIKDSIRSLQQQSALQGLTDGVQREKLIEHDDYFKHIFGRLRALEHAPPPQKE
jgi:hypothetical protein